MRIPVVVAALVLATAAAHAVEQTAAPPAAPAPAKKGFTVEGITLKLWDETTGKVIAFDKPPNPYGLNLTLVVVVKVKGPTEDAPKATLTLDVGADASSDEATGDHPAWKQQLSRPVWSVGERGVAQFVFVLPYECANEATFTATVGTSTKTLKRELPCAE